MIDIKEVKSVTWQTEWPVEGGLLEGREGHSEEVTRSPAVNDRREPAMFSLWEVHAGGKELLRSQELSSEIVGSCLGAGAVEMERGG